MTWENEIDYSYADKPHRASRIFTFPLWLRSTRDLNTIVSAKMEEQVACKLGVDMVRICRQRDLVLVEVQLPKQYHKPLLAGSLQRKGGTWITLGKTAQGGLVHINMAGSLYPHALVGATTGGGKTCAMQLMLWEMALQNSPDDIHLLVIDGKGGVDWNGKGEYKWRDFGKLPHLLHPIIADPVEAFAALAWLLREAKRREDSGQVHPRIFVFIDEIRELLAQSGGKDGDAALAIQRLTSIGRGLGIHVIIATQHPTSEVLGGSIAKANLPLRLAGRVMGAPASVLVTGQKGLNAHRLYGEGDFLADGHRLQVAYLDERHMTKLPRNGHDPHHIDLSLDLARALGVAKHGSAPTLEAAQVAWALWDFFARKDQINQPSAKAVRDHFGGGMDGARAVRDFAQQLAAQFDALGMGLRVTGVTPNLGAIAPAM